jgi:hypothetical protein
MAKATLQITRKPPIRVAAQDVKIIRQREGNAWENSKRFQDLCSLAETMHNFARVMPHIKQTDLQMFAHRLLQIAHTKYRKGS